ncbi:class I SAM-dependent methyltransferase [Glaesserella parasuis]|nr:class I SAM-dependent methyltransferase [Glaesserella parasuis]MDO9833787.1 class I SAM-dependent methyltransferase [Glaesserella parasuis]
MKNWSEGYINDVNYTVGYYDSLNPNQMTIPFLMSNLQPPKVINACELGFGFGVSINVHAAASSAKWYGTDFNPSHALFAQQISNQVNPNKLVVSDEAFAEFCERPDLPDFDFIALHGIWSWISPQNRQVIVDFIQRKLKVGGVVYISYNTLPGWASKSPIRYLLNHSYTNLSSSQNKQDAIKLSLENVKALLSVSDALIEKSPKLLSELEHIEKQNINYLIHEYLNKDWQPMYFSEVEDALKQAKLTYTCSASYLDDFDDVLFNEKQLEFMDQIKDPSLKQTAKDFILNKQFRRDYWIKGQLPLTEHQVEKEWRKLNILLIKQVKNISKELVKYQRAEIKEEYLQPIIEKLSDYKVHSLDSLCNDLKEIIQPVVLFKVIALLASRNDIVVVQPDNVIKAVKADCDKFNQMVIDNLFSLNAVNILASPVTGGGIKMNNIEIIFISAYKQKIPEKKWEAYAYSILKLHNQMLLKDNQTLKEEDEALEELSRLKQEFLKESLDVAKILKLV